MTPRLHRLGLAGAALCFLLALATDAHCAVWIELRFTAPADEVVEDGQYVSGVGRYRLEVWSGSAWDSVRIYRAPGVEGVPVQPESTLVLLYVSQTVATHTSRTYRLLSIDNRGNWAEPSNFTVVATGFPDTLVGLSRPARGLGSGFRRTYGVPVGWGLQYGDTAEVRALHQEEFQQAASARLCQLFGTWALRGVQRACP